MRSAGVRYIDIYGLFLQQRSFLLLRIVLLLTAALALAPVKYTVLVVHHPQDVCLVGALDGRNRDIAYRTEFTAVIQMLVLQTEKVPYKSSEKKYVARVQKLIRKIIRTVLQSDFSIYRKTSRGATTEVIKSLDMYPHSTRMKLAIHANRSIKSSIIAK